jgi:hypothetical protein
MATQAALRQHFLPLLVEDIIAYRSFDSSEDLVLTLSVQEKINGGDAYKYSTRKLTNDTGSSIARRNSDRMRFLIRSRDRAFQKPRRGHEECAQLMVQIH